MSDVASELACLGDARLATHATSAGPAWLWSPDATRILWANPVGAAMLGAPTPAALAARAFDPLGPPAAQIARIAGSLHPRGAPRLERLRGFGGGLGRALTCACARIALADRTPGILVVAAEPAGPTLALAERLRRLFADSGLAIAAFAPGGAVLHATPQARLDTHATLAALGAESIAADALAHGRAEGNSALGPITVERLGTDASTVLVATFTAARPAPPAAAAPPREHRTDSPPELVAPLTAPAAPPIVPDARAEAAPPVPPTRRAEAPDRRHPLRFVWQMDATEHFTLGSDEFTEVIGPTIATGLGRPWPEINAALALDPEEQVARAIATRDTWSGITVSWPVDGCADRLKVELSGLPIFDRNRSFQGYRGFGVCRDIDRIATLAAMRRPAPPASATVAPPSAPTPMPVPAPDPAPEARPALTVVPAAANVVPFRGGPTAADAKGGNSGPNPVERSAFHELARQLSARLKGDGEAETGEPSASPAISSAQAVASAAARMIAEPEAAAPPEADDPLPDARAPTAQALVLATSADDTTSEATHRPIEAPAGELTAVLDAMIDGALVIEPDGRIVAANRAAALLFGYDAAELLARRFAELVAPASRTTALANLAAGGSGASFGPSDGGHEIIGQTRHGATLPLRMWLRPIAEGARRCAILRDMTPAKEAERDVAAAREAAERAAAEKTAAETAVAAKAAEQAADKCEFVAKVSHELRTPLNSIVGFAEVMLEERFGPIGNERYRDYLKDMRGSGEHAVALLNDLMLLVKIAAGQLELDPADVNLNDMVQAAVAQMQPQANRERIIIRTSLAPHLPPVVGDPGALRQIALNLLANAIRLTGAGGQVIVSTAPGDTGEAVLRVRDTGVGMDEKELAASFEPFRRSPTASRWGATGTGLCLPLTRALAHANRARFTIASKVSDGTLIEVAFRAARGRAD